MDPIFLAEIIVVGLIIVGQFYVFFRNLQATRRLGGLFPSERQLDVDEETETGVALLKDNKRYSIDFRDIVQMTNDYLRRNRGSSQGERLQEIAERKSDSMEEAIETNLPLPLYIGLLATFTGVIIGLVQIALEGVSDAAIQSFIGGVVVGMIGSATGLLLTVRSNQAFKEKKEERDQGMEHYFQFLRTRVFHPEAAPVQGSIKNLRDSLAAFQDGFAQYQGQMNDSLQDTLKVFNELKGAFQQVRTVGQELKDIGSIIQSNEAIIEKQAQYFTTYNQKAEAFTRKLSENLQTVDQKVEATVQQSIKSLDQGTQSAYLKMDQFLASLEGSEQKQYANSLLERMKQDAQSHQMLTDTVRQLNDKLERLESGSVGPQRNSLIQTFLYMGIAAFVIGMGSGVVYLIRAFGG
jgi:hypothetical protein